MLRGATKASVGRGSVVGSENTDNCATNLLQLVSEGGDRYTVPYGQLST